MDSRIAINGFGRIGRLTFRQIMEAGYEFEIVGINDIAPPEAIEYLLKHDSVHGPPDARISAGDGYIRWNDTKIRFFNEKDPANLPWGEMEVGLVLECSGVFTDRDSAASHLKAGANHVLVSAPVKGTELTICYGVNEERFDPHNHKVVSNASCTTNCVAPVAKVLDEYFGIERGFVTTVHAVTSGQKLVDAPAKKLRRGRSALTSIVPTTTGAAQATAEVLPNLKGRLDGMAMRVPVIDGSIIDFVVETRKETDTNSVNDAFRKAAGEGRLHGILGYTDEELVSADIIKTNWSALVDGPSTSVLQNRMVKVLAWYDNEWAYARRLADAAEYMIGSALQS